MTSAKDYLRYTSHSTAKSAQHLKNIEGSSAAAARSAAQNTELLKGIAFTSSASMVFNGITAANTARQARTQERQLALQQEQHALQQAMAEQTARHEFSMWRQTPEGSAFVDWQQRAVALVPLLRDREHTWNAAWSRAIERARAQTTGDERQRFSKYPARLKQSGFRFASIASLVIAGFFALGLLFQGLGASAQEAVRGPAGSDEFTYQDCLDILADPDNVIMNEADCEAINPDPSGPIAERSVGLALFAGLGIAFFVVRKVKQRQASTDPTVRDEAEARVARWGFDPLTTQGAWYPWHESQGFTGYADRIEHMVHTGPQQRPQPSQLIPLQVPTPWPPAEHLPEEVNQVLSSFQEENAEISGRP